jgi:hypothetical protein
MTNINIIGLLILMIFCHIVDDYYLQGCLASMKQKSWWEKNYPAKLYKYDYLIALLMHCISWATTIMLPIMVHQGFNVGTTFLYFWLGNVVVHYITDYLKADALKINLIEDQFIHIAQILITWSCYCFAFDMSI